MKLETVLENVLYSKLIAAENGMSNIISGLPLSLEDIKNIQKEIDKEVKNYFIEDESIIVIVTYGGAPDVGNIKIYHANNLTGEIELLRICNIDEPRELINNEYLTKRYRVYWFSRGENDVRHDGVLWANDYANDSYIEIDGNVATIYDDEPWEDPEGDPPMS